MIIDLETWVRTDGPAHAGICIVGAGPAGLDLAVQLARHGRQVTVLEGGGREFDPATQALHRHRETGQPFLGGNHDYRADMTGVAKEAVRVRQYGGTSTIWSGKWKLPDPIDLLPRPWLQCAGWPITWEEIAPHARAVMGDYHVPERLLTESNAETRGTGVIQTFHYEESPPANFATVHEPFLAASKSVRVVLHANVVGLVADARGSRIEALRVRSLSGESTEVRAEIFVLAVGGIETARLLLASTTASGTAVGNQHGWVGRGFMEHPKAHLGTFQPTRAAARAGLLGSRGRLRQGIHTRWTLHPRQQEDLAIPNHAIGLFAIEPRGNVLLRRIKPPPKHALFLFLEQMPYTESRIALGADTDALGCRRPIVHWTHAPDAADGVQRFVDAIVESLTPRFGYIEIDPSALSPTGWAAGSHHMGTARMASRSEDGVVDRDCRVFGTDNLYVAGSAVFPTGGNANPMLLLLAVCRRLANHLSPPDRFKR